MVTVNVPAASTVKVAWSALVMCGEPEFTVSVNVWVAFVLTPLLAVIVIGYMPPVPAAGVPAQRGGAVTVVGERHAGRQRPGLGESWSWPGPAVVVTVNDPAESVGEGGVVALVMIGGASSRSA